MSQIGSTLDEMQVTVSGYSQQIGAVQEGLSRLKSAIGRTLTWGAVILSLILLWIGLSQVALVVLAWRAFSGRDLWVRERDAAQRPAGKGLRQDRQEKL